MAVFAQQPAVGLHAGSDFATSQYDNFGTWLGRKVTYRLTFLDKSNWSELSGAALIGTSKKWVNSSAGRTEVISMAMLPNGETGGLSSITRGTHDWAYRSIATKIRDAGIASKVIIRLGWEANGNWYLWHYQKDPTAFKAAWRRIVGIMRGIAPGLRFEFNISNLAERGSTGAKWTAGYPGDDVVDVVSMDIYDHWHTWTAMRDGDAGLKEMRNFAIAHNKLEAYSEWALVTTSHGHGDNPTFVKNMASWMASRPGKVLYQAYWNTTGGALLYSSTKDVTVPNGAAAYKSAFGASATSSGSNTAPTISSISDRTIDMNGSTGAINFTIGDGQSSASSLTLIKGCSDESLIPESRVVFGGSGANRTVTISPVSNKTGESTIWIKVSDGQLVRGTSFVVKVSGTESLSFDEVGSPGGTNSYSRSGSAITMRAGGHDIYGRADAFYFGSRWVTGDAEMIVKVSSLTNTNAWTKAGLMFRTSGASNSAFVGVFITPSNGCVLQWRSAAGNYASTEATMPGRKAAEWLRLVRDGDSFYAFCSEDRVNWDYIESVGIDLPSNALAGIALVAHTSGATATAVFDQFSVD